MEYISRIPLSGIEDEIYRLNQNGFTVTKSKEIDKRDLLIYYQKTGNVIFFPLQEKRIEHFKKIRKIFDCFFPLKNHKNIYK